MELLAEGKAGRAVGIRHNKIIDVTLDESIKRGDCFDKSYMISIMMFIKI